MLGMRLGVATRPAGFNPGRGEEPIERFEGLEPPEGNLDGGLRDACVAKEAAQQHDRAYMLQQRIGGSSVRLAGGG